MADLDMLKQSFETVFTDAPVNWIKWGIVFAVLILGYVLIIKCKWIDKILHKWEHKREIAQSKNHILSAKLRRKHPLGDVGQYDWNATYSYVINGEEKTYHARFKHPNQPPIILYLYYIKNPNHLFSVEENHWDGFSGLFLSFTTFSPFLLAVLMIMLLKIEI